LFDVGLRRGTNPLRALSACLMAEPNVGRRWPSFPKTLWWDFKHGRELFGDTASSNGFLVAVWNKFPSNFIFFLSGTSSIPNPSREAH